MLARLRRGTEPGTFFPCLFFSSIFRETLEAAIIVSVLLSLVEQIVYDDPGALETPATASSASNTRSPIDEKESEKGAFCWQLWQ